MNFEVRHAKIEDIPAVLALLRELAEFEGKLARVQVNESLLAEHGFGRHACIEILIGELDGRPVSYAIFFPHFGSYCGRPSMYLEDLYVQPSARGTGLGRAMMARLAQIVLERNWAGMSWSVLDWNEAAFRFYNGLGAVKTDGRSYMELEGEALVKVATE